MSGPISMLVFFEGPPTAEHETPQRALSPNAPRNFPANAKSTCKAMIGGQP